MTGNTAWLAVRGAIVGLAAFALAAHALLLAGTSVPAWLLPACLALGLLPGTAFSPPAAPLAARPPRALLALTALAVGTVAAAAGYGAVAAPARDWDGAVAWSLKAKALTAEPTLAQPLFADPAVLHHSPDYPLLQPLCQSSLARLFGEAAGGLLFPALYVLLVALVGLAVRRRTGDGSLACWIALGLALVPQLAGTGGGAIDSGYAETFAALALAAAAAGLLLGDPLLLGAGAALLPLLKPEGTVHAGLLAATAALLASPPLCAAALAGAAVALCTWLPLQGQLLFAPPAGPWPPAVVLLAAALLFAGNAALHRRAVANGANGGGDALARGGARRRTVAAAGVGAFAVLVALLLARPVAGGGAGAGALSHYLDGGLERAYAKLADAPAIVLGLLGTALAPRRFGLLFWLLAASALLPRRWRAAGSAAAATAPPIPAAFAAFVASLPLAVLAAFFLSPEPDVQHHLRSSAPRLLLQTAGACWLLSGALLARRLAGADLPRWLCAAFGRAAATAPASLPAVPGAPSHAGERSRA